jgi:hypothetical protein
VNKGAKANVVSNYYIALPGLVPNSKGLFHAIVVCNPGDAGTYACANGIDADIRAGGAYVEGNIFVSDYHKTQINLNGVAGEGKQTTPYSAPTINTTDASIAACRIVSGAGARPIDAFDKQRLNDVRVELGKFGGC